MLAGLLPSDSDKDVSQFNVGYKPQKINLKFKGTVRQLFHKKIHEMYLHSQFQTDDIMKPLNIDDIIDQEVTFFFVWW
jgi:ATP-binding cassette subfamily E protein 1